MRTEQITLALAVNREKSIKKAADTLSLSRAAASIMLIRLEEELGYPIFDRINNTVRPTEKGILFLEQASLIERTLQNISRITEPLKPISLQIASLSIDFSELAFEKLCRKYCKKDYAVNLGFKHVSSTDEARKMMESGEADVVVAIVRKGLYAAAIRETEKMQATTELISEQHLELTCKKGHPIIKNGKIADELFGKYSAFLSVQATRSELYAPYFLARHDIGIKSYITLDPGPMRYRLLRETDGYLISLPIPDEVKEEYHLESVPIRNTEIGLLAAYRNNSRAEDLIQEYLGYCREFV